MAINDFISQEQIEQLAAQSNTSLSQEMVEQITATANAIISQLQAESVTGTANTIISQLTIELLRATSTPTTTQKVLEAGTFGGLGINWWVIPQLSNYGNELRDHVIKAVRPTGKMTAPNVGVFGYGSTEPISVPALSASNINSKTGPIPLASSTEVDVYPRKQVNVPNCKVSTVRLEGTWDGTNRPDRVDEIMIEAAIQGVRR